MRFLHCLRVRVTAEEITILTDASLLPPPSVSVEADRRQEILAIASNLFARKGFHAVSIREIADAAGIMGGSLYHHFRSKEALYLEVHGAAFERAARLIRGAIVGVEDPWRRLEIACATHLEILVDPRSVTLPLISELPRVSGELRAELVRQRDQYEDIYRELIADLPLAGDIDRNVYRLSLLSLMNSVPFWFHPGRLTVAELTAQVIRIFKHPV